MDDNINRLAEALGGFLRYGGNLNGNVLVTGTVTSWPSEESPSTAHRVTAEGMTLDENDLSVAGFFGPYDLRAGDAVLLAALEEHQRFVVLGKVVSL